MTRIEEENLLLEHEEPTLLLAKLDEFLGEKRTTGGPTQTAQPEGASRSRWLVYGWMVVSLATVCGLARLFIGHLGRLPGPASAPMPATLSPAAASARSPVRAESTPGPETAVAARAASPVAEPTEAWIATRGAKPHSQPKHAKASASDKSPSSPSHVLPKFPEIKVRDDYEKTLLASSY